MMLRCQSMPRAYLRNLGSAVRISSRYKAKQYADIGHKFTVDNARCFTKKSNFPTGWKPSRANRKKIMKSSAAFSEQVEKEPPVEQGEDEQPGRSKWHNWILVGASVFTCVWVGAIFAQGGGSEPPIILDTWDQTVDLLHSKKRSEQESGLKVLTPAAWKNKLIREKLATEVIVQQLLSFITITDEDAARARELEKQHTALSGELVVDEAETVFSPELQGFAVELLMLMTSQMDAAQHEMLMSDLHLHRYFTQIIESPHAYLFVKKTAATGLANLASKSDKCRVQLGKAGVLSALHWTISNELLFREKVRTAAFKIAEACADISLPANEGILRDKYAAEYALKKAEPFYELKTPLVESGAIMYVHTILGGAVWALASGLFIRKLPRALLFQSMYRTALITGLVPAYFIGGVLHFCQQQLQTKNEYPEVFALLTGTGLMVMLPWVYLLPVVDAYCPLWIGGHVVGFMFFFTAMWWDGHDMFKSDHQLKLYETEQKRIKEAQRKTFFKIPLKDRE